MIPKLLHTHLSPPHAVCDCCDEAAAHRIFILEFLYLSLTPDLARLLGDKQLYHVLKFLKSV
jgi:hypothetical protein